MKNILYRENLKILCLIKKISRFFAMVLNFIALKFYEKFQKIAIDIWFCKILVQLFIVLRGVIFKNLFKFN